MLDWDVEVALTLRVRGHMRVRAFSPSEALSKVEKLRSEEVDLWDLKEACEAADILEHDVIEAKLAEPKEESGT